MYVQVVRHAGKWAIQLQYWWRRNSWVKEIDECGMDFGHIFWDIVHYDDLYEAELEAEKYAERNGAKYARCAYWEKGREAEWKAFQEWKEGSDCDCCNCKSIYRS